MPPNWRHFSIGGEWGIRTLLDFRGLPPLFPILNQKCQYYAIDDLLIAEMLPSR